ncbi:malate synthase A [Carboxydochorda subterranea]|uniref:malate synthase n=1 Tax=Carboxydichorda subterranea TaxID=3109565 RepID=A0ABZ1BY00_9FIRM|nr:malate synthase A [Limnochorda sp. L945t]WRP17463.1 malate synthase A [Limnochorda sp. L945t]
MSYQVPDGVELREPPVPGSESVLTPAALAFVAALARTFGQARQELLRRRADRLREVREGKGLDLRAGPAGEWKVASPPSDLVDRRVEITGPTDPKMIINALNSGAQVFMADFEDANAPTWANMVQGQAHLRQAVRRTLSYVAPDGRVYRLGSQPAVLSVRPRGWHLDEPGVWVDGRPVSASLFDFGLFAFHNARELLQRGSGPYFYLPKLEGAAEARLWNEVFEWSEQRLGLPSRSIRATVLIEHVLAALEMEGILYELRDRITGLNLGRWDYIFSFIKTFAHRPDRVLPDRALLTVPSTPFLRTASQLLVHVCHRRGAHAIGGMSAYIPRKDDPDANERALAQVRADKEREAGEGYDGAWVAHPGLVGVVREVFERAFPGPNQLERMSPAPERPEELLAIPDGPVTEAGLAGDIDVALRYLAAWLSGRGAVAIHHLMEDTATAEIARSQLWQWVRHRDFGALYRSARAEQLQRLRAEAGSSPAASGADGGDGGPLRLDEAAQLLDRLVLDPEFVEFLTIPGLAYLRGTHAGIAQERGRG